MAPLPWRRRATPELGSPANSVVASARRIDPTDKRAAAPPKRAQWQDQAWMIYDAVGEVKFATNFVANILSRCRLYVATLPEPDASPVEVTDPKAGALPGAMAIEASAILDRLNNAEGGISELLRAFALNMEVPGELWLYGLDAADAKVDPITQEQLVPARDELWCIKSTNELRYEQGEWKLYTSTEGQGQAVPEGAYMVRIWQRHPQFSDRADSFLQGVLQECVELLLLSRAIRAAARSRLNAGLLLVPSELSFGPPQPTNDGGDGTDGQDPFSADLVDQMMDPIEEEGDPAGQVPQLVRGKAEFLHPDVFRKVDLSRTVSDVEAKQRMELLARIGQGLNVPPEVITGIGQSNHWSGAQIDRDLFGKHIEPRAVAACDAITTGFLRPFLRELGYTQAECRRVFVWYDESEAVTQPNRTQDAKDAHKAMVLSDEALRKVLAFSENDAPTPEELLARVGLQLGIKDAPITEYLLALLMPKLVGDVEDIRAEQVAEGAKAVGDNLAAPEPVAPAPTDTPVPEPTTAAGRRQRNPGEVLAQLDRSLGDRLHVAVEAAMARTLERAGNVLRSRVQANQAVHASIRTTPPRDRAATLGRPMVAALGITDDDLLGDDPWATLHDQYDRWTADTQATSLTLAEQWWGELGPELHQQTEQRQTDNRASSWTWLAGTLTTLAAARLYDPHPSAPPLGEHDPNMVVPVSVVRQAMARAGGATGTEVHPLPGGQGQLRVQSGTEPAGGVATGEDVLAIAVEQGVGEPQWEWQWGALGAARHPFPGHQELDGLQFVEWDDPELAVSGADSWLGVTYYSPGDHDGCNCFAAPIFPSFNPGRAT